MSLTDAEFIFTSAGFEPSSLGLCYTHNKAEGGKP